MNTANSDIIDQFDTPEGNSKRIAIAGASGLIGTALRKTLTATGWTVCTIGRSPRSDVVWDPKHHVLPDNALAGCDVVLNLAGAGIAGARWSAARKQVLWDSRIDSTKLIAERIAALPQPPRVYINASAIGFYGSRGDEMLSEASASGAGFMPDLCRAWEAATEPAARAGVRTVNLRIGVVLTPLGGALQRMLTPFRWGVGGVLGSGRQYMSWIGLHDIVRLMQFIIDSEQLSGPVNATSPQPVTNAEYTKTLGAVLHRPTLLPAPGFAIRLLLGEMGQRLLLEGNRVLPQQAQAAGFEFAYPDLAACLRRELGQ